MSASWDCSYRDLLPNLANTSPGLYVMNVLRLRVAVQFVLLHKFVHVPPNSRFSVPNIYMSFLPSFWPCPCLINSSFSYEAGTFRDYIYIQINHACLTYPCPYHIQMWKRHIYVHTYIHIYSKMMHVTITFKQSI